MADIDPQTPASASDPSSSGSPIHSEILILGSGPAGWTAAVYGARAMRSVRVVTGMQPGGQLTITTDVENWPGDTQVMGPDLMNRMQAHAEAMGALVTNDHITEVDFTARPYRAIGDGGTVYTGDAVIVCTGAQAKWLGLESEYEYQGFGVSACATCDGFFYREKEVVVVGGGNTAVEEALFLTNFASKVTLVHRRDALRAEKILQDRLFKHPKIDVLWNHQLAEVLGTTDPKGVTGVRLESTDGGPTKELDAHGVFIAIGHAPATELFAGKLDMQANGYLVTAPDSTATNVPGVFAAGDVTDDLYRQAVTAAGMGCMAALEAERFLEAEGTAAEAAALAVA